MNYDVVVIGGGVLARAITHAVAERGYSTACVFPRGGVAGSATAASGAMLSTVSEVYLSEEAGLQQTALRFRLLSAGLYDDWLASIGADDAALRRTRGTFMIANTLAHTDRGALELIRKRAAEHGVSAEPVNPSEIPGLRPELQAWPAEALYLAEEGSLDSGELLDQLERAILRHARAAILDDTVESLDASHTETVSIRMRRGAVEAKQVVVASGAYTSRLLQDSGLTGAPEVFAGRGVSALLEPRFELPYVIRTPNRSFACGLHVVPRRGGLIYLGATNRFSIAPSEEASPTVGELNPLLAQAAQQINAGVRTAGVRATAVGHRPLTLDRLPIVGRIRPPSILVASGTYRNGVVLAPLIARLIAEEIDCPGVHARHPLAPSRPISNAYRESPGEWLAQSADAMVESLLEMQQNSHLQFQESMHAFVYAALGALIGEDAALAPVADKVKRFVSRVPIEEALPSLIELLARSPALKQKQTAMSSQRNGAGA
jgi:glycine oxidase